MQHSWRAVGRTNMDLINQLKEYNIVKDPRVEAALRAIDRKNYCDDQSVAYMDAPSTIGYGATISAPHMHAMALESLKDSLQPGANVLDVGSGSGYLTAAMMIMVQGKGGRVLGIDRVEPLVLWSIQNVQKDNPELLEAGLELRRADGWEEIKETFDVIHVGAAATSVPTALVESMKPGGKMVIPIGPEGGDQYLYLVTKHLDGSLEEKQMMGVRYVPLVKGEYTDSPPATKEATGASTVATAVTASTDCMHAGDTGGSRSAMTASVKASLSQAPGPSGQSEQERTG